MTGNTNALFYAQNPSDPPQQQRALAFMRAQMLAQQFQQSAQMPADNEMAGNVVVKHSPLEYLSRTISQNQAMSQQLKAAQMQMQMMGDAQVSMQNGAGATGAASGSGLNYAQQRKAAMDGMMFGDEAQKADLADMARTNDQKNDNGTPGSYAGAVEGAKAPYGAPSNYTDTNGDTFEETPAMRAKRLGMASAMNAQQPPAATPSAPVQPSSFGLGGNPPPPPAAPAAGGLTPTDMAPVPQPPIGLTPQGRGIETGEPAPAAASDVPIPAGASIGGAPLSPQMVNATAGAVNQQAAAQPALTPNGQQLAPQQPVRMASNQVQSPAQAGGAAEDYKNLSAYENNLNKRVNDGAIQTRITNSQEDLMTHFHPGAGAEELAKAAAAANALGASPALVASIARGDQNAVGAVQAFSAMASQHAAVQSLETMAGGGGNTPRISQSMFQSFKDDLSNPNKQENAIKAINALGRQLYQSDFNEQQAFQKFKATPGNDPRQFQAKYAAQIEPQLMAGRSADPAQAIQSAQPQPPSNAVDYLKKNPSLAAQFDQKYGLGAAAKLLGR